MPARIIFTEKVVKAKETIRVLHSRVPPKTTYRGRMQHSMAQHSLLRTTSALPLHFPRIFQDFPIISPVTFLTNYRFHQSYVTTTTMHLTTLTQPAKYPAGEVPLSTPASTRSYDGMQISTPSSTKALRRAVPKLIYPTQARLPPWLMPVGLFRIPDPAHNTPTGCSLKKNLIKKISGAPRYANWNYGWEFGKLFFVNLTNCFVVIN